MVSSSRTRLQALEIALLRSGGTRRQLDSTDGQKVRDFGRDLFDALIQGDVRSRFDASLAEAERADRPLRVRLRFDAPALAALPWEFLYDQRAARLHGPVGEHAARSLHRSARDGRSR